MEVEDKKTEDTTRNEDPLAKEIDEMLSDFQGEEEALSSSEEPEVKEEEKPTEEVETPPTEEEAPPSEPTEPTEDGPIETPPTEDAPTSWEGEKKELQDRIDLLVSKVEELSEFKLQGAPKVEPKKDEPKEEQPKVAPTPQVVEPTQGGLVDFLGESTIDVLIDEEGKFNEVLNSVYQSAVQEAERKVFEKVLTSIPDIIVGHLNRQTTLQQVVKTFYESNQDLVSVKRSVAAVANDVHSENPDWEITEVLKEAANRTREMLGIKKGAKSKDSESPAFAKAGGTRAPVKKTSDLQSEIDDLINF